MGIRWTQEDLDYLEENYGKRKLKFITRDLNRSEKSIYKKAFQLGLQAKYADDGLTLLEFRKATRISKTHLEKLIREYHLPSKVVGSYRKIYPDRFWWWAKRNKELINWGSFPELAIGEEPGWVAKIRKQQNYSRNKHKPWSKNDDIRLSLLLKEDKYTHAELAKKFGRTIAAIDTRAKVIRQREKELENKNLKEERF